MEEYVHEYVPGALNLPQADLASRLGELSRDRPLLTICRSKSRWLPAASVKGGTEAWRAAGKRLAFGGTSDIDEPRIMESTWAHAGVF